jgi:hypothetical protein
LQLDNVIRRCFVYRRRNRRPPEREYRFALF